MVLGAGPAGSMLAERLSRRSYHVALVEHHTFPRYAVGESLPPSVELLLKRIGVLPRSANLDFPQTTGYLSAWGSESVHFTPHDEHTHTRGHQVERAGFDAILLQAACAAGTTVLEGRRPVEITHTASGWRIVLQSRAEQLQALEAKFLCDATGRARVLARKLRLTPQVSGHLIGLLGYWNTPQEQDQADAYNTLVESLPDGWCYTAQLDGKKRVAGFMTDRELLPVNLRHRARTIYSRALARTRHVQHRLADASWDGEMKIFAANPSLIERCCGADWLLVGDAVSTLDPLCSQGVQKAIASALAAFTVVNTMLVHPERRDSARDFYCERERAGFLTHLNALRNYYQRERRWKRQPFWKARAGSPEALTSVRKRKASNGPADLATDDRLIPVTGAQIVQRPVVEGEFIEMRPVVVAPDAQRGLRYCGRLCVPDLLELLDSRPTVDELLARYQNSHAEISSVSLRSGLAQLLELGIITSVPRT
jgi:flavin-dependent dehydrogenase